MARKTSKAQASEMLQGLFMDPGAIKAAIEIMVREALEEEMARHIGAGYYERGEGRSGHRNGTKPRTMKTVAGEIVFDVPQVREGGFRTGLFERYQRSDKALVAALQEMYVQGVSTRAVGEVLERMAGFEVSAATVSRAMTELDEQITAWRARRLDEHPYPYLLIDARYEKVRIGGRVRSQAVLVAVGISDEGRREMLGFWVRDSESKETWSEVLGDLRRRGVSGVELVVSDAHLGIRAAMDRQMQGVAWQRCRVHLMRELVNKAHYKEQKELSKDLRAIYVSEQAERCLEVAEEIAVKWEQRRPALAQALREGIEATLEAKRLGPTLWRRLSTTNVLERQMRELKRRTRAVGAFPNVASLERLIGAMVMETDETWACEAARYMVLDR